MRGPKTYRSDNNSFISRDTALTQSSVRISQAGIDRVVVQTVGNSSPDLPTTAAKNTPTWHSRLCSFPPHVS
jgi:hypothetical protein